MQQTVLDTIEDLDWLRDVHGVQTTLPGTETRAVLAILYGNEDCPARVEVCWRDHYRNDFSVYEIEEDGNDLRLVHQGSLRLRERTADEREAGCL